MDSTLKDIDLENPGSGEAIQCVMYERPKRFSAKTLAAKLLVEFSARPMTDFEAARRVLPPDPEHLRSFDACRRRCSDLRAAGLIEDSGERRGGRIWRITQAGREALKRLLSTGWSK